MKIGIIGGSGLERPDILKHELQITRGNKWGRLQSPSRWGIISDTEVIIISRHGPDHSFSPSEVDYRVNINHLKKEGCTHIIATSACGSLCQVIRPQHFVIPTQFIDFTKRRINTFYESFNHGAMHASLADPFDQTLRLDLLRACKEVGVFVHDFATVATIEGPRFSTRAESLMFKNLGCDIINMTTATEAALAMEAGIPYAVVCMSTDYDSWKDDEPPVDWEMITAAMNKNAANVLNVICRTIELMEARNAELESNIIRD